MVVDPQHVEAFDRDGYCVVPGALPPAAVANLLGVVDRIKDRLAVSGHTRDVFGLDVRPIVTEDDAFLDLLEWPATFPLAVRCLRHYSVQLNTSHLIMVPPRPDERNTGWHQDGGSPGMSVNGVKPMFSLEVGYFLTDLLEPDMGQLMVVPGSHRRPEPPVFREGATDPEGAVQLRVRAGDAVVFANPLWHGAAPNRSTATRIVLYYGYAYRWLKPIDYETMPADLMARCGPIGRQLLGARTSHLGWFIPTDADCPLKELYRAWFGETWIS